MNISILFVDDDKDVIDGYQRMLFSMKKQWELFFAISGDEALNILSANKIDVVVSDMKMPVMDGVELLSHVKDNYPHILRIILSGHQDVLKIIRSTTLAHQFLLKPCDTNLIKNVIENAISLRSNLENQKLLSIINGIGQLPMMPELYKEIEDLVDEPDVSLDKIRKSITRDPAITAKIIQTVNSAFFGLPRRVTDMLEALSFLGTNTIKSIILYLQSYSTANVPAMAAPYCKAVGRHSLIVAQIAKEIAMLETSDKQMLDDIYIAGILHDVGKLILIQVPDYFRKMDSLLTHYGFKENEIELKLLGVSHEWAGAYLLGIWGLPKTVVEAIAFHHSPEKIHHSGFSVLTALYIANTLSAYNQKDFDNKKIDFDMKYLSDCNLKSNLELWWSITQKYLGMSDEQQNIID